jgi:CRP-like cAMP-binding protein
MMTDLYSIHVTPRAPIAAAPRIAGSALHAPCQNRLLAALPLQDYERLLPQLEPVTLPPGHVMHRCGEPAKHVYFLTSGIAARVLALANGHTAEFAVTGSEGVIGITAFLGGVSTPSNATALTECQALRMHPDLVKREFERGGPLTAELLRYTHTLITQIGVISACMRHHSLDQRLCRWLLSCADRLPSNEVTLTQELISTMLGVRREGVTEAVGFLCDAGLIRHSRGQIVILDRPGLEARACECYHVIARGNDQMIGPAKIAGSTAMRWDARRARVIGGVAAHPEMA